MDHHWHCSCPPGKETDSDSDNDYGEDEWDPHAGIKPSPLDGEALDEQWDPGDVVEDAGSEFFNWMVKMILDLQDDDLCDQEWKPKGKKKRRAKPGQF